MTGCPTGDWISANINGIERCYLFNNEKLSWNNAKVKCGKAERGIGSVTIKNNLVGYSQYSGKVFYSNNCLLSSCTSESYLVDITA